MINVLKHNFCYNETSMEKEIYQKAMSLKEMIDNDERIINLSRIEKEMENNEEVMALSYKKDLASTKYSDILNYYSEDSEEAKKALKELHEAKLNLDNHPLVKEYLKAYKEVRELYQSINEILFSNFNANLCPKGDK